MVFHRVVSALILGWSLVSMTGCDFAPSASAQPEHTESPAPPPAAEATELRAAKATQPAAEATQRPAARATPRPAVAPCPEGMTQVEDSCVDRYEAHLVVEDPEGNTHSHPAYERPTRGVRYLAKSEAGVNPQAYISSVEAAQACENAGKRLCSVQEWFQACRGPQQSTYPYGFQYQSGRCNVARPHVLSKLHGKDPMRWTYDNFNDPELIKQGYLAPTAEFSQCTNEYGTYDMVGNLHEWVADRVDDTLPDKIPLKPAIRRTVTRKRGYGIFMGGFFSTGNQHGNGCEFATIAHEPKYHDYSTGFRCCKDATR